MKVGLFIPCFVDQFFPETGISLVKILRRLNVDFEYPEEQTCCGQPAFNTGYRRETKSLAKRFIDIFSQYDCVVAPSGSCVTMVKIFYPTLDFDSKYMNLSTELSKKIFEFSEFLVDKLNVIDIGSVFNGTVTYHDSCHLLRELKVEAQPRTLLKNVQGVKFIESDNSKNCCGFGGTFAVKFSEISASMVEDKVDGILRSKADYVVANDSSCLMNIDGFIKKNNLPIKALHLIDLLAHNL